MSNTLSEERESPPAVGQLEIELAQRTRDLSLANQELRHQRRELDRAASQLSQLEQLKADFVTLVNHELCAPLANLSGSLQLLLEADPAQPLSSQRELLLLAQSQVERLTRLVKGTMTVMRLEAGQLPCLPRAFDILALIDNIMAEWRARDPAHRYRIPRGARTRRNLPSVWADPERVSEVLATLLDNASRYSPPATEIAVQARVEGERMLIAVVDQGVGIPPEYLARIFDKFARVENDDARASYGHGLGLFIAHRFVNAMGGEMWAESQVGVGSTFYFSLPLAGHQNSTPSD